MPEHRRDGAGDVFEPRVRGDHRERVLRERVEDRAGRRGDVLRGVFLLRASDIVAERGGGGVGGGVVVERVRRGAEPVAHREEGVRDRGDARVVRREGFEGDAEDGAGMVRNRRGGGARPRGLRAIERERSRSVASVGVGDGGRGPRAAGDELGDADSQFARALLQSVPSP